MRVLITGNNGYIGKNLRIWLYQYDNKYHVDSISVRTDKWKEQDFSEYDAVFHTAAVVHKKEQVEMESLYYSVNRDLTMELAKKAKCSGVKQFIFMSSISVYGLIGEIDKEIVITRNTPCIPNTLYGKSKLEAENALKKLEDAKFNVAIIRAPMIYGPNCPGNYMRLKNIIMRIPVFPEINNKRSMLYIDNLSEFIRIIIDNNERGLFFPQNLEYTNTAKLVQLISNYNFKKIYLSSLFTWMIKLFGTRINIIRKIFGNLVIEKELSVYKGYKYCIIDLEKSIKLCEYNTSNSKNFKRI
jgi:UDP-glucose 4-epimerase